MKRFKNLLFTGGIILGFSLIVLTGLKVGWIQLLLFALFMLMAVQDAFYGKIKLFSVLIPILIMAFFFLDPFLRFFVPMFAVLFLIWTVLYILRRKSRIPPAFDQALTFGFGDVLGIPYALALAWVLSSYWGFIVFGFAFMITMIFAVRRKTIRLLPWLLPGLFAALIVGLII